MILYPGKKRLDNFLWKARAFEVQINAAYKKPDALVCVSDVGRTRGSAHSNGHGLDEGLVPLDPIVISASSGT